MTRETFNEVREAAEGVLARAKQRQGMTASEEIAFDFGLDDVSENWESTVNPQKVLEILDALRAAERERDELREDEKGWAQSCADFAISMKASFDSAEAENATLRSQLAEAREALEPFAKEAEEWSTPDDQAYVYLRGCDDDECDIARFNVGDLRRAADIGGKDG